MNSYLDITTKFTILNNTSYKINVRNYSDNAIVTIVGLDTYEELSGHYNKIKHLVAGEIQTRLLDFGFKENLIWNLYLVFVVAENMNLKYLDYIQKIENDKFSCKKYVLQVDDYKKLDKKLEEQIPYLINLKQLFLKDDESQVGRIKKELSIPENIKNYIEREKMSLKDFVEKELTIKDIKLMYKEVKNEK